MTRKDDGPGVPEAIPRTLQGVADRLGTAPVDRLWVFPPRIKGRRESGLVVLSCFTEGDAPDRRRLFTASYGAERTGKGLTVEWSLSEEGTAPPDRLPPVMEGVLRRAGDDEGEVREVALGGDLDRWTAFLDEWDTGLLDPALWPRAIPDPVEAGAAVEVDRTGEAGEAGEPTEAGEVVAPPEVPA